MGPIARAVSYLSVTAVQRLRSWLILAALVALWPAAEGLLAAEGLNVGIFPRRDSATTRAMFQPLVEHLGENLGLEVQLDVPPDFEAFWDRLKQNRYDLVHLNPYQYLRAHQRLGYDAILMNEEMGRKEIRAVIWVRRGSGIHQPAQLKGRKIIFGGGRQAMVSHIMAVDLLRRHGLSEDDYLAQYAVNPVSAMLSLYYRQSAAAGAGDVLPHLLVSRDPISPEAFVPLLRSDPVAQLPWAVSLDLSDERTERIQQALTDLKRSSVGRQLLAEAGLSGFVMASDEDYDPHRRIVARILQEHY